MDGYRVEKKSCTKASAPALRVIRWLLFLGILWIGFAGSAGAGDVPDEAFFMDYMKKKAGTFFRYKYEGLQPYLDMTLENNKDFICITPRGEEVDFDGYLEVFAHTFSNLYYKRIEPLSASVGAIDEDTLEVRYTVRMVGLTCGGAAEFERENLYVWKRIKAGDTESLQALEPKNLEKYFAPEEDKWIVTEILYR